MRLRYRAARLDLKLPLLESVLPGNEEHLHRAIQSTLDLGNVKLGIVGLAFKENTDDLRESPVVGMLEHLDRQGPRSQGFRSAYPNGSHLRLQPGLHPERDSAHRQASDRWFRRTRRLGGSPGDHAAPVCRTRREDPCQRPSGARRRARPDVTGCGRAAPVNCCFVSGRRAPI